MICLSLIESKVDDLVRIANSVDSDLVEIRFDFLSDTDKIGKLQMIKKPIIITCMPEWENGNFGGDEEKRVAILLKAMKFSDYVTVELNTKEDLRTRLIREAKKRNVKTIVSYHDFEKTPAKGRIMEILDMEKKVGADIAKVAFMAKDYGDVLRLMQILNVNVKKNDNKFGIPIIAISMGKVGTISRILAPLLGSYLTYASAEKGMESAQGQLTVKELKQILGILKND